MHMIVPNVSRFRLLFIHAIISHHLQALVVFLSPHYSSLDSTLNQIALQTQGFHNTIRHVTSTLVVMLNLHPLHSNDRVGVETSLKGYSEIL